MNYRQTGELLLRLRKSAEMTQAEVARQLGVSPQAVSRWERGLGLPDTDVLPQLAEIFKTNVKSLLTGSLAAEKPDGGNMKRLKFYVCPDCGNVVTASGGGEIFCCGRKMEMLSDRPMDEEHAVCVQEIELDWYVTFAHPMEKNHYFRFAAVVTVDRVLLVRLYPEQGGEFRIPQIRGGGKLYLYCSRDGLFSMKV